MNDSTRHSLMVQKFISKKCISTFSLICLKKDRTICEMLSGVYLKHNMQNIHYQYCPAETLCPQ